MGSRQSLTNTRIIWNLQVNYRVHKSSPLHPNQCQGREPTSIMCRSQNCPRADLRSPLFTAHTTEELSSMKNSAGHETAIDLNGHAVDAAASLLTHITANKVGEINIHEGESSLLQLRPPVQQVRNCSVNR